MGKAPASLAHPPAAPGSRFSRPGAVARLNKEMCKQHLQCVAGVSYVTDMEAHTDTNIRLLRSAKKFVTTARASGWENEQFTPLHGGSYKVEYTRSPEAEAEALEYLRGVNDGQLPVVHIEASFMEDGSFVACNVHFDGWDPEDEWAWKHSANRGKLTDAIEALELPKRRVELAARRRAEAQAIDERIERIKDMRKHYIDSLNQGGFSDEAFTWKRLLALAEKPAPKVDNDSTWGYDRIQRSVNDNIEGRITQELAMKAAKVTGRPVEQDSDVPRTPQQAVQYVIAKTLDHVDSNYRGVEAQLLAALSALQSTVV